MKETVGTRGLILNEPFLWERGGKGRTGYSLPRRDVEAAALPENLAGDGPGFPRPERSRSGAPLHSAVHLELRGGFRHVPAGFLHHEVQSQNQ
jgi:hypothetical protein